MTEEEQKFRKWQRRQFSHVGLVAVCFMLVTVLAQFIIVVLLQVMNTVLGGRIHLLGGNGLELLSAASMYLIAFPVSAALIQLIPKCGTTQKQYWGIGKFAACLVILVGVGLAGNVMGQLVEWLKPWGSGGNQLSNTLMDSKLWVNVLVAVIMAPVVEELFFRKMIMDRLLGFGEWPAILMSGLMFGLAHGNFSQFFYAFGIGLLFAYMYARTGRVSCTIACHMLFNFLGGVVVVELSKLASGTGNMWFSSIIERILGFDMGGFIAVMCSVLLAGYSMFMVACLIGGITILVLYRKEIHFLPGPWPIQKNQCFQTMVLNVGVILYLLVCAGLFLVNW